MSDATQEVGIRFEDTEFGPSLAIVPEVSSAEDPGVLAVSSLHTVKVTGGPTAGSTYIWDPNEVLLSPIL